MAIQMRRGNQVDFDPSKMVPGEWAISQDEQHVYMCFTTGVVTEIGSAAAILPYFRASVANDNAFSGADWVCELHKR